jgi:hypothetical protein
MLPQRYASGTRALTFEFAQGTSMDQLDKANGAVNPLPCLGSIQVTRAGEK